MSPEVQAFATGFPATLAHAVVSLIMLALGAVAYGFLTPHREVPLIREGNTAAAISLGGVLIGLAIPLAVSLAASPSILETVVWGVATVAVQLLAFRLTDFALTGLSARIQEGDIAAASLLTAGRLATALILAAAVTG
jgi:putative membrane protein